MKKLAQSQTQTKPEALNHKLIFKHWPSACLIWVFAWWGSPSFAFDAPLDKFVHNYCVKCHGTENQEGDRRFDSLTAEINSPDDALLWQEILDQLNQGAMPPEDEKQPDKTELLATIDAITQSVADATQRFKGTGAHTVLRRLNSFEYRHTIGDLLKLPVAGWNPAADFPPDVRADGFDNNSEAQVTSGILLDHYLVSAEDAIKRATAFGPKPESKIYQQKSPFYFEKKQKLPTCRSCFRPTVSAGCRTRATTISWGGIIAADTWALNRWREVAFRKAGVIPSASKPPPSTARTTMTS